MVENEGCLLTVPNSLGVSLLMSSPEYVCGVAGVERVHLARGLRRVAVVAAVQHRRLVDVQRRAQEDGAHVLQVRARRPEPPRHPARRGCRHEVPDCERLVEKEEDELRLRF